MYVPNAFAEIDLSALDALIARDNFITLVTVDNGAPVVSHLPVLYRRVDAAIELTGHWSRANPQSHHAGRALAIVHGPNAYVSPSWYPDKESAARVPTWNYATAHLQGELQTFRDETDLGALVGELTRQQESRIGAHWAYEHARDDLRVQLAGITGFRLLVSDVQLKFKLSQNHPLDNRRAVAAQLAQQASQSSRDVAELMRSRMTDLKGEN